MNTSQLECIVDCDPLLRDHILGVYPSDHLPRNIRKYPYGFIANTDIHTKPGQHWCAFSGDGQGHVRFFDSYGRSPSLNSDHFERWIRLNAKTVTINTRQIQSDDTNVCGLYCVFFLRQWLMHDSMEDIVNSFDTHNTRANDSFILDLMSRLYPGCLGHDCGQTCTFMRENI